jgi:nucleoside-diphosphate-sugar epimerase
MGMNENVIKKVAILGGSGKVGHFLTQSVSDAGYEMRVLMRNPDKIKSGDGHIEIVQGDARDSATIRSLLQGCDTVLNALNHSKGEAPICSTATSHVLAAMKESGIRRYILVRGFSINAPGDHKDLRSKLISMLIRWVIPGKWADWQKEFDMLLSSDVDWTVVRLPIIVDEPPSGRVQVDLASPPGKKISGRDIANFVVAQITEPTYVRKAPFIGN